MKQQLQSLLPTAVAIMVVLGIALHDTKLDSLTKFAIALPVAVATYQGSQSLMLLGLGGEAHTHVERVSIEKTASRATGWMPNLGSRQNEDKKYRLNKSVQKGHHPFDNYSLPVLG